MLTREDSSELRSDQDRLNEAERLRILDELDFARTATNSTFLALTKTLCELLHTPVARISVVGRDQMTMVAPDGASLTIPRDGSFCDRVVTGRQRLIVRNRAYDFGVTNHPWLIGPDDEFVAYVGIPLMTSSGHVLGTLCGFDRRPRELPDPETIEILATLADSAMAEVELFNVELQRVKNEDDLRRDNELLQTILENIDEGVSVFDGDHKLVAYNNQLLSLVDLPKDLVLIGTPHKELSRLLAEQGVYGPGKVDDLVKRHIPNVGSPPSELELKKGQITRLSRTALQGGGFLTTYRDVTDERRRDAELKHEARVALWHKNVGLIANESTDVRSALTRFCRFVVEKMEVGLAHVARVSDDGLVSVGLSTSGTGILRWSSEDASAHLQRGPFWTPLAQQALETSCPVVEAECVELGGLSEVVFPQVLKAGFGLPLKLDGIAYVIELYGSLPNDTASILPVTAEFLEASFSRVAAHERLDGLKQQYLEAVEHQLAPRMADIKRELRAIALGLTEALPEAVGMLNIARANSARLERLIENVSVLNDIERDELTLSPRSQRLRAILSLVREEIDPDEVVEIEAESMTVWTDPVYAVQILQNLLSNAIKFSPPGETVRVDARREGSDAVICVNDRGPGVAPAFRSRLFGRFNQADASDTRREGGAGLGLAVSKRLAEELGGSLQYIPGEGRGSSFVLTLPVAATTKH